MLGNIINVKINFDKSYTGRYDGRQYVVHTGIATDDGPSSDAHTLRNILVFSPDTPLTRPVVRVKVMAVTELHGKIHYICCGENTILYAPVIREVLSGSLDLSSARITCLYEKSCGAVIYRRHSGNVEYLLIKNRKGNNWGFPKGHMEVHESERQTALREVKEETGLSVHLKDGFRTISEYHPKGKITKQVIFFLAEMPEEDVVIQPSEIERFIWADYSLAVKTFRFNNDKKVLSQAKNWISDHLF